MMCCRGLNDDCMPAFRDQGKDAGTGAVKHVCHCPHSALLAHRNVVYETECGI